MMETFGRLVALLMGCLCVAIAAIAIRSYAVVDELLAGAVTTVITHSHAGSVEVTSTSYGSCDEDAKRFFRSVHGGWHLVRPRRDTGSMTAYARFYPTCRHILGFWYMRRDVPAGPMPYSQTVLVIPYWMPLVACALAPARWFLLVRPRLVYKRRVRRGLCAYCGYDLRATPQRCPECGRTPYVVRRPLLVRLAPPLWRGISATARIVPVILFFGAGAAFTLSLFRVDQWESIRDEQASAKWLDAWFTSHAATTTLNPDIVRWRSARGAIEYARLTTMADPVYVKRLYFAASEHHTRRLTYRGAAAAPLATEPPTGAQTLFSRRCGIPGVQWVRARWQQNVPMLDPSETGESAAPTRLVTQTTAVWSLRISYLWIMLAAAVLPARRLRRRRHTIRPSTRNSALARAASHGIVL